MPDVEIEFMTNVQTAKSIYSARFFLHLSVPEFLAAQFGPGPVFHRRHQPSESRWA